MDLLAVAVILGQGVLGSAVDVHHRTLTQVAMGADHVQGINDQRGVHVLCHLSAHDHQDRPRC